jgi:hypothetical protein
LAECYDGLGLKEQARQAYIAAKDCDVCPLRMLESMHAALREVADETGTPLVDVRALFEHQSRDGIADGELLVDHVHPNIRGHQMIGEALANWTIGQLDVRPPDDWPQRRERIAEKHLAGLDDFYFAKGQERLRALRGWTKGLARRQRPDENSGTAAVPAADVEAAVERETADN